MIVSLLVFTFMIVSFCLNKIPMYITSFLSLIILTVTNCISPAQATSAICNNTTLTISSMFLISGALSKTSFISSLTKTVYKVSKGSFRKILAGYVFVTFLLGQFIPSTTAIFALIFPIVVASCKEINVKPSKMIYSIALVTTVCSFTFTPIGPYAANFIENNGYQMQFGITGFENTPYTEMLLKLPPTIFAIIWAIFFAPDFAPEKEISGIKISDAKSEQQTNTLSPFKEKAVLTVFCIVILSLLFNSFGLPTWIISSIGVCLLVILGIYSEKEIFNKSGLDVVLLYAGVSSLGTAFSSTGAGDALGKCVLTILGNTQNSYALGFAFFVAAFIMTSLIYNRAVSKILIPIVLATASSIGCDPRGLIQMCYIGSMCSLLTPMATSVVPMMMTGAGYTQKDLIKMGIVPSVLLCIVTVLCGMTMYPCF